MPEVTTVVTPARFKQGLPYADFLAQAKVNRDKIAEATGAELRVFRRDENPDIMDEYLLNGKSRAIPVFVFYTKDHRHIAHFLERSAGAHKELAAAIAEISAKLGLPPGTTYATVPEASKAAFVQELIAKITPRFPAWRKEAILELRTLLSAALRTPDHA